jgi:hypothetical protein
MEQHKQHERRRDSEKERHDRVPPPLSSPQPHSLPRGPDILPCPVHQLETPADHPAERPEQKA